MTQGDVRGERAGVESIMNRQQITAMVEVG